MPLSPYRKSVRNGVIFALGTLCLGFVLACALSGCGGGGTQPPVITVTVTAASASVQAGGTVQVTAGVGNDSANKGVTWNVSCSATQCGSVSPATTSSGAATTYTAPSTPPASDLTVTITATSASDATKSATTTIKVLAVSVSVSPTSASVVVSMTQPFTATVSNDASSRGVTWALTQGAAACSPGCGTVSPTSGAGNTPSAIFTAPASVPSPATVTITATSAADPTKSSSVTITVTVPPPISVGISPTNATVEITFTQQFNATVSNDPSARGVTWVLTQSGMACSPACGSLSPATAGNFSTTYLAPATVPTPSTVTLTATSVADTTKSASATITVSLCGAGNEPVFQGQYAFLFQGFDTNGPVAIAGAFDADGTGKIALLVGVEDINNSAGVQTNVAINSAGSSYSVGPDNRGCLVMATSSGMSTYRFSLGSISSGVATKGRMIEFDNTGTLGSGVLRLQDPAAFVNSAISGNYALGASSTRSLSLTTPNRYALVGTFTSNGGGMITSGEEDFNLDGTFDNGAAGPVAIMSGLYSVSANGRGTLSLTASGAGTLNESIYVISANEFLFMNSGPQSASNPLFAGSALKQAGGFTTSSLSGPSVLYTAGLCGSCGPASTPVAPNLTAGVLKVPTTGSFSLTEDLNKGGTLSTQTITGMYTVDSSGRVLLTQTGMTTPSTAIYLVGPNQGFVASTGSSVDAGFVEPQVGAPFSNTSLSATYFTGTTNQVNQNVTDRSGQANFDPRDRVTGTMDDASIGPTPSTANLSPAQSFAYTYMLTNVIGTPPGRGTVNTGTTTTIFYIISHHCLATCTSKIVLMDGTTNPALTIGETR